MTPQPIEKYFTKKLLRYSAAGFVILSITSFAISLVLTREQVATQMQESAVATAHAFHDRILDGDVRFSEPQIKELLKIREGEAAEILRPDFTRVYNSYLSNSPAKPCPTLAVTCFDGWMGQARIAVPISLSDTPTGNYRLLYVSKKVDINWTYLSTIFLVFSLGYLGLLYSLLLVSRQASLQLSSEVKEWADQLKQNPKHMGALSVAPFQELEPLRGALAGLNSQIEEFEKTATDKARLLILRGIAHDLLTPVARLQMYVGTFIKALDPVQHGDTIDEIRESLGLVIRIATQVKALNELDSPIEPAEIVAAAKEEIQAFDQSKSLSKKDIKLEFNSSVCETQSPFSKAEISRIILNLIQNAADASSPGSVINLEVGSNGKNNFLTIKDTGCGVPDRYKDRVFDADFTLKPCTGTGLGLAIVKYICERRSAKIQFDSRQNEGTKVTIEWSSPGVSYV